MKMNKFFSTFIIFFAISLTLSAQSDLEILPRPVQDAGKIKQQQLAQDEKEVKSLEESIKNDQISLKKIEDSGSGIEDYKFVKQNLSRRKVRLKELKGIVARTKKEIEVIKKAQAIAAAKIKAKEAAAAKAKKKARATAPSAKIVSSTSLSKPTAEPKK